MGTLGEMQDRIADELARDDLSAQITKAIKSAIQHYERRRFYFNETRDIEFSLSDGQEFYSSADNPDIPRIVDIDRVTVTVSNNRYTLTPRTYGYLESISAGVERSSIPEDYAYYAEQLRIYPIPNQNAPVRVSGVVRLSTLSASTDSNAWTTDAEELIRTHAKRDLYAHVIRDIDEALVMQTYEQGVLQMLDAETTSRASSGRVMPSQF